MRSKTSELTFVFVYCRHDSNPDSIWDASEEEREELWEHLYAQPGFGMVSISMALMPPISARRLDRATCRNIGTYANLYVYLHQWLSNYKGDFSLEHNTFLFFDADSSIRNARRSRRQQTS